MAVALDTDVLRSLGGGVGDEGVRVVDDPHVQAPFVAVLARGVLTVRASVPGWARAAAVTEAERMLCSDPAAADTLVAETNGARWLVSGQRMRLSDLAAKRSCAHRRVVGGLGLVAAALMGISPRLHDLNLDGLSDVVAGTGKLLTLLN